eukprot:3019812-Prymnesium_polylepis.1
MHSVLGAVRQPETLATDADAIEPAAARRGQLHDGIALERQHLQPLAGVLRHVQAAGRNLDAHGVVHLAGAAATRAKAAQERAAVEREDRDPVVPRVRDVHAAPVDGDATRL